MSRKIFYNGHIQTQEKQFPSATAFIVEDGKFTAVGNDTSILAGKQDTDILIDLHQQTVLPGFHDAHIHIWKVGNLLTFMLDLRGVGSLEEMLDRIRDYQFRHPHLEWIQARGFNEALFPDKKMPTRFDLDKISVHKPIVVIRTCAHQVIVNSKALELTGIHATTETPSGGEIKKAADGALLGHFTETAIGLVLAKIPRYSKTKLREMVLAAQREFIATGITAATDPAVDRDLLEVYKEMAAAGELTIRINAIPIRVPDGVNKIYPVPELFHHDHLTVNTVKFFADGGLSGKTAALSHPYKNSAEQGVLRLKKEVFKTLARETQSAGFKIATHAIGDAAIDLVVEVLNEIAHENIHQIHHRIEHLGLPSAHHLWLMKEMQISAVMQPVFIKELGKNFREALSEVDLLQLYPCRSVTDRGISIALSTDAPVVKDFNPMHNIQSALDRTDAEGFVIGREQCLTLEEALYAYTMGSAVAGGMDNSIGSVSKGKWADFNVFTGFPLKHERLSTYIAGELQ